jgi:hypothetical protein
MDWHRPHSPTLPVRFPASTGRGVRTSPPSAAPAGLSFPDLRTRNGLFAALWSAGFGLAVAWIGPDRFNTIRFALFFLTAALAHLVFADRTSTFQHTETRS